LKRVLSISPWPSIWSQGEQGGSPSEGYAIQAMRKAGFEVTHLSPGSSGLPGFERSQDIRFIRIKNPFLRFQPILKTGFAFAYRLPAILEWTFLVSCWLKKSGERFNLVVGHSSETIFALRRAARYLGVPAISRIYGISAPLGRLRSGLRRELYFDLLSLFRHPPDHLILTDDGTCGDEAARIFGIASRQYDFLLNGYDPLLLSIKCEESSSPYILTACRLVDWKRVDRVVRVAALCKSSLPEVRFIILGDGTQRPSLEELIRRLGVSSTVQLMGRVSRTEMYEFLKNATAVLSTQDLSNLNNTVLESLVLGKPVLTLDTGCTSKLIRHEETGLLYQPDDLEGVAGGIERVINDRDFRKTLGKRAKAFSRNKLKSWAERVGGEAAIYHRFI
jgi:glycosyltransferase involved in cell wall biosynthesis